MPGAASFFAASGNDFIIGMLAFLYRTMRLGAKVDAFFDLAALGGLACACRDRRGGDPGRHAESRITQAVIGSPRDFGCDPVQRSR